MSADEKIGSELSAWPSRVLVLSIAISALGYLGLSLWGGWREVFDAIANVGLTGTLITLGLSLVNYLLRSARWLFYLRLLGSEIPWLPGLKVYLSGFALATTPAKAGELVRGVFLRRYGVPYVRSFAAYFAERFNDVIAVALIAAIGVASHSAARPILLGLGALLVVVFLMVHNVRWLLWLQSFGRTLSWRHLRGLVVWGIGVVLQFRRCFALPVMIGSLLVGLIAWGAEAHACYLIATWMGADITIAEGYFVYAFASLVGALSLLPGGLGSFEVTLAGLLILHGMAEAQAIACTLFVRVVTLWFAVALGLVALPRARDIKMERSRV